MVDLQHNTRRALMQLLVAALIVDPLGDGLSLDELTRAAYAAGISAPLLEEVLPQFWQDRTERATDQLARARSNELTVIRMEGSNMNAFPPIFPVAVVDKLEKAFAKLDEQYGTTTPKPLQRLIEECLEPPAKVKLALGMLMAFDFVKKLDGGFRLVSKFDGGLGRPDPRHPLTNAIGAAVAIVEPILASRGTTFAPWLKPIDRFEAFLAKQGWKALASWWANTARELESLWNYHPTAATVLAGAMLEAALVAVAEPARKAGEWRHKFLAEDSKKWQLKELIAQAVAANTFTPEEGAFAVKLADVRNRIHVGRFAASGPDPFRPQCTNAHEAQLAKAHLEMLLVTLLDWQPVAALI